MGGVPLGVQLEMGVLLPVVEMFEEPSMYIEGFAIKQEEDPLMGVVIPPHYPLHHLHQLLQLPMFPLLLLTLLYTILKLLIPQVLPLKPLVKPLSSPQLLILLG